MSLPVCGCAPGLTVPGRCCLGMFFNFSFSPLCLSCSCLRACQNLVTGSLLLGHVTFAAYYFLASPSSLAVALCWFPALSITFFLSLFGSAPFAPSAVLDLLVISISSDVAAVVFPHASALLYVVVCLVLSLDPLCPISCFGSFASVVPSLSLLCCSTPLFRRLLCFVDRGAAYKSPGTW